MTQLDRRRFLQLSSAALTSSAVLSRNGFAAEKNGPASMRYSLDQYWMFAVQPADTPQADAKYVRVALPHTVKPLSWENWDATSWEQHWAYRREFTVPRELSGKRIFVRFDAVSVTSKTLLNGQLLGVHHGGYLPFGYEVTQGLKPGANTLDVLIDATWQNVPPDGSPKGFKSVDYFEPAGIIRPVTLEALPQVFLSDVYAKPLDVLKPARRVEVTATIDAATTTIAHFELRAELRDGEKVISSARQKVDVSSGRQTEATVTLEKLGACKLWDVDAPQLYTVVTTLYADGKPLHEYTRRIGLREASFTTDGFFLNGRQMHFFGLNRHEVYPYTGFAMPARVMRHDAEVLKNELHVNMVRCSHYPQHSAFLDACDELGMMVWQEPPGWQWLSDDKPYVDVVLENVHDMIIRDRNRPSVVIWGVRLNETRTDPSIYDETTALAKKLDATRPCSGSMTSLKPYTENWHEDVYSMDDYHSGPDGGLDIYPPLKGIPYMLSETVGQKSYDGKKGFSSFYYRGFDPKTLALQAVYHAQAHDRAAVYKNFNGVIAWCAFEYPSPANSHKGVKNPGVYDHFRMPKLGATFYWAQVDPRVKTVIAPNFYWDFGSNQPKGPGKKSSIFSNCERLEVFVGDKHHATLHADKKGYPNTKYPPFFVDLELDGVGMPELRIEGYIGSSKVGEHKMSADHAQDKFVVDVLDEQIAADGADASRVAFRVADAYGNDRQLSGGKISFELNGPGVLIGDNPFDLTEAAGVGAVWVKSLPAKTGKIELHVTHDSMGSHTVSVEVIPDRTLRLS
jgi:beta-galactosidase